MKRFQHLRDEDPLASLDISVLEVGFRRKPRYRRLSLLAAGPPQTADPDSTRVEEDGSTSRPSKTVAPRR